MQLTLILLTTLVGDHPRITPVKFGENPISSFSGDVLAKMLTDAA